MLGDLMKGADYEGGGDDGVGGAEVLRMAEVARPVAGVGQVVVKVKAAGVNPIDYKLRKTGALGYGAGKVSGV